MAWLSILAATAILLPQLLTTVASARNDSRDWVIDKFNIPLPLSVDSEKIRKMIKGIGEDLALDPELGPLIRQPLNGKL